VRDESIPVQDEKDTKRRNIGAFPVAEVIARFQQEVQQKRIRQVSTASAGLNDASAKFGA
jgi:threonyl-tRNA synthetase